MPQWSVVCTDAISLAVQMVPQNESRVTGPVQFHMAHNDTKF